MLFFNSTVQLNEKIKRFEQHLIQQQNQQLQKISSAVSCCQNCHDKQSWYLCLSEQNLTHRQIAILEGTSPRQIREILSKNNQAQKVCLKAI